MGNFKNITSAIAICLTSILLLGCHSKNANDNMPNNLEGVIIHYTYSEGNAYALKFEKEGVKYQFKSGSKPEKWWGKFSYNHLITDKGEHLVSWHEPEYGDYVTLLIDFDNRILYGSAILKAKTVHFQKASITKIIK